jgi:hypothetical protein
VNRLSFKGVLSIMAIAALISSAKAADNKARCLSAPPGQENSHVVATELDTSIAPTGTIVQGNFHNKQVPTAKGAALLDLAYVSMGNALSVMMNKNGCFFPPAAPSEGAGAMPVGVNPALIAVGMLDDNDTEDIAVVDVHTDSFNRSPLLKILLGDGCGHFKPSPVLPAGPDIHTACEMQFGSSSRVAVFPLGEGESPVALTMGRFRGKGKPIDLAIVSRISQGDGVLRVLFNNGKGEFGDPAVPSPAAIPLPGFTPAAMIASDNFRNSGEVDLVIKEAGRGRILYLQNASDGTFPIKMPFGGSGDSAAGDVASLLVGVLNGKDSGKDKLDIITYDQDMTLRVFVNDGFGSFAQRIVNWKNQGDFRFAPNSQFSVFDAGDKRLRLAAVAIGSIDSRTTGEGILTLQSAATAETNRDTPEPTSPCIEGGDICEETFAAFPFDALQFPPEATPAPEVKNSVTRIGQIKTLGVSASNVGTFEILGGAVNNQLPNFAVFAMPVHEDVEPIGLDPNGIKCHVDEPQPLPHCPSPPRPKTAFELCPRPDKGTCLDIDVNPPKHHVKVECPAGQRIVDGGGICDGCEECTPPPFSQPCGCKESPSTCPAPAIPDICHHRLKFDSTVLIVFPIQLQR